MSGSGRNMPRYSEWGNNDAAGGERLAKSVVRPYRFWPQRLFVQTASHPEGAARC